MANNSGDLKKFAQAARRQLREQVAGRLEQVLKTDSAELRQKEAAVNELRKQIARTSKKAVVDRVAYTWFNRFCALRFMDANRYNRVGIVSPAEGYTQPEILQEAKKGYIDEALGRFVNRQMVLDLLGGRALSSDPQQEAYRLLLVGICNSYNETMPFLFERIEDYTELLMPLDLLSENAVLHQLREVMTPETCQDVEVIGWLYQYYISERKDEVFEALKQNQKIEAEDIPAATQLFTPHWIVRYLVENSLGRLWMLNRPQSRLVDRMEYYIRPVEEETDFLRISSPEEIKICDPACGSGHMLTYAFDLLYAIYEEEGYAVTEIPGLILKHNLYGIEIDERAGALAAFALTMKARGKDRRFFTRPAQPNICVLENVCFTDQELNEYMAAVGRDLFTDPLRLTLRQFEQADNFGSLIRPILTTDTALVRAELERKILKGSILLYSVHEKVLRILEQAEYLSQRYQVVVANPPYMNAASMNDCLKNFAKDLFPESKFDLFSMFIERNLQLVKTTGLVSMITMQGWMFLSSFEKLRVSLLKYNTILALAHLGSRAFDTIGGEIVSTVAFIVKTKPDPKYPGIYIRLVEGGNEKEKERVFMTSKLSINRETSEHVFSASSKMLSGIPGAPIAYWLNNNFIQLFNGKDFSSIAVSGGRCKTHNDELYTRQVWEVSVRDIGPSNKKWKFYNKGGYSRKWYGNLDCLINWSQSAKEFYSFHGGLSNPSTWNRVGVTWSGISSGNTAYRLKVKDSEYASASPTMLMGSDVSVEVILGALNTPVSHKFMSVINPTIQVNVGDALRIPFQLPDNIQEVESRVSKLIAIAKKDWDSTETSLQFQTLDLLLELSQSSSIAKKYLAVRMNWQTATNNMHQLEQENNQVFISAYKLNEDLSADLSLGEITLTRNPHCRYGGNRSEAELEALLLADTMREFISYAVGCMFGRYSLDKPGLILANQGETLQDYLRQVPDPTFMPDEDNAIPVLDGDWFSDDIAERFKKFLRVTFGNEHYDENLAFIEEAIGRDIRGYFLKEFYAQHLKMYQKRPIYWLFSSPKGSFNVLIYMHRYTKDTVSVILNRYLREFRAKLEARKSYLEHISISASATPKEKTVAVKDIEKLNQILEELRVYERDILYPLAAQPIEIDLDDGVKVNYAKFGRALVAIK
ncbi:MAG TPA: BREX-1 system adenine-specific DNA-methyltransferase PglX [Anaerolineaceae bacterium]|nr:BREX-1 system adenine-specific DNA-methyltransferase PglX [Anaerolineaceae bacterium]HPN52273.1 BREX-1 system adenine-specific DNA-methyltransferase PglX [Anaerolineaceae bacterium]